MTFITVEKSSFRPLTRIHLLLTGVLTLKHMIGNLFPTSDEDSSTPDRLGSSRGDRGMKFPTSDEDSSTPDSSARHATTALHTVSDL